MKRFVSILLCLVLVLSMVFILPLSIQTASAQSENYYLVIGKSGNILGFGGEGNPTNVTIPSTINGVSVKSIDGWAFQNCKSLSSITIPNSVTSIGDYAFDGCTNFTNITIPSSITSIGDSTFGRTPWLNNYQNDFVIDLVYG